MQEWTQEESIAYECARDAIGAEIALISAKIHDELEQGRLDDMVMQTLRAERSRLFQERAKLRAKDHEEIAKIRAMHGKIQTIT
ncbi:hypothetical protein FMZ60_07815 [Alcaligenaceae bacterium SJ-26]|nr:hypothetical protein FMZ60_07815 [Alcaligenaceae bacterium SJ-26]